MSGCAAHFAQLGAKPAERHTDHDLAGGMAVEGVIWGYAATIGGVSYTLIGVAVLFLTSLLLTGRLYTLDNLSSRDTKTDTSQDR